MAMSFSEMKTLFPKALSAARKRSKLSVQDLASKAKISPLAIQKHEEGKNLPTMEYLLAEMDAMGLDFGALHELLIEARQAQKIDKLSNDLLGLQKRIAQLEKAR